MANDQQEPKRWSYHLVDMDKHRWAFYYFCKRKGDLVWVDRTTQVVHIEVR